MFIVAHGVRSVMRLLRFLTREKQHYIRHIQLIELCGGGGVLYAYDLKFTACYMLHTLFTRHDA